MLTKAERWLHRELKRMAELDLPAGVRLALRVLTISECRRRDGATYKDQRNALECDARNTRDP